jgi:histidinol-phosphate aminotransferase
VGQLRGRAAGLASELGSLGVRTYPTETYSFLADFAPHDAAMIAARLRDRGILLRPLGDAQLGPGFMRVTTSRPEHNARLVAALKEIL